MRLESALYASRSGIDTHGQAISVIGDNIANANTVGYRSSRVEFNDIFAETQNPSQSSGDGALVARVRQIHETGVVEPTNRDLDVAIEGRGFFLVGSTAAPEYSRAGNFSINEAGKLVNSNGLAVLGFAPGTTTLGEIDMTSVKALGSATTQSALFGNLDSTTAIGTSPTTVTKGSDLSGPGRFLAEYQVYDSLGAPHSIRIVITKTQASRWEGQAYIDGGDVGGTPGVPTKLGGTAILQFGTDGVIAQANKAQAQLTAAPAYSGGAAAGSFTVDLSGFAQFAATSELNTVTQNGFGAGQIKKYSILKNGVVAAVLDDGSNVELATMALGSVPNIDGLQRSGSTTFVEGAQAGTRAVGTPGSNGYGTLSGGSLERSTVDLANQFVELVLYQRGYQANSSALSTASQLIKDTIGLMR
jgi:flagellar hook protein FlgE